VDNDLKDDLEDDRVVADLADGVRVDPKSGCRARPGAR